MILVYKLKLLNTFCNERLNTLFAKYPYLLDGVMKNHIRAAVLDPRKIIFLFNNDLDLNYRSHYLINMWNDNFPYRYDWAWFKDISFYAKPHYDIIIF